jgi:hypothetical protein
MNSNILSKEKVNEVFNFSPLNRTPPILIREQQDLQQISNTIRQKNLPHTILTDDPLRQLVPGTNPQQLYKEAVATYNTQPNQHGIHKLRELSEVGAVSDNNSEYLRRINLCKAVQSADCNAFNNPEFAKYCGICLKPAEITGADTYIGGMYIDPDIRDNNSMDMSPSVGKCYPGSFVLNKDKCQLYKNIKDCKEKNTYSGNCGQCYTTGEWNYINNDYTFIKPGLFLKGNGTVTIKTQQNQLIKTINLIDSDAPTEIKLTNIGNEGDLLYINVKLQNATFDSEEGIPYIGGYLIGTTQTGRFSSDLSKLIETDTLTNARPRMIGFMNFINNSRAIKMTSGVNRPEMNLILRIPFSFVSPVYEYSNICSNGPMIKTSDSARQLGLNVCYTGNQSPGNYSQECLQSVFLQSGCTTNGTLYPNNNERTNQILQFGTLDNITNNIQEMAVISLTGKDSTNNKIDIQKWNEASMKCRGVPIENACDITQLNGKVTKECLDVLYRNGGATVPRIGPTYTTTSRASSLNALTNAPIYCTSAGKMNPASGESAVNKAMNYNGRGGKGTLDSVKEYYNKIHGLANSRATDKNENDVIDAIKDCYGINIDKVEKFTDYNGYMNMNKTTRGYAPFTK